MANSVSATHQATTPSKPRRVDIARVLTYVILSAGVVVVIVPFLWMISTSLMTLGEATGRALLAEPGRRLANTIYEKPVDFKRESAYIYNELQAQSGGLDLTGKAAVLKTAGLCGPWGFESLVLRTAL